MSFNSHNHFDVTLFVSLKDTSVNTIKMIVPTECPKKPTNNNRYEIEKDNE
jgi:hypothetical protein